MWGVLVNDGALDRIRQAFRERTDFITRHALDQLFDRGIHRDDLRWAITEDTPEIIEDYPDDARGPSCLILCFGREGTAYHAVCSYPQCIYLITAYFPDASRWSLDFRERVR